MVPETKLIKVGRQGVQVRGARVPSSFFRHQQPGKQFVVLAGEERRLMHVRAADLEAIRRAYRSYRLDLEERLRKKTRRTKK